MKHILTAVSLLLLLSGHLLAKEYRPVTWKGNILVQNPGGECHRIDLHERLHDDTVLFISEGDFLTLQDADSQMCVSFGKVEGLSLKSLRRRTSKHLFKRFVSAFYGVDSSDHFHAAIKGDDPTPAFLHAYYYGCDDLPLHDISFQLIKDKEIVSDMLSGGDIVSFRITNKEPVSLFICIVWVGSDKIAGDCLAQRGNSLILVPPLCSIDLDGDTMVKVTGPIGRDRVCLFASEEEFSVDALIKAINSGSEGAIMDIPFGFQRTDVSITR